MNRRAFFGLGLFCVLFFPNPGLAAPHPVSVDDLMRLRWIADVQIAPDGERVAYVVSQPNVESNTHDAVLYIVPAAGGTTFHFVTEGIETALERAMKAAGGKDVALGGGADVAQQYQYELASSTRPPSRTTNIGGATDARPAPANPHGTG